MLTLNADIERQSTEDSFVEAGLLKVRRQRQPGGETALRNLFAGLATGNPDYTQMTDSIAKSIKVGFSGIQRDLSKVGDVEAVKFMGIDKEGMDKL